MQLKIISAKEAREQINSLDNEANQRDLVEFDAALQKAIKHRQKEFFLSYKLGAPTIAHLKTLGYLVEEISDIRETITKIIIP
jgi:hypothetical protein